ncbi:MAG TPA: SprT family zinc-dependent metalloprotease [Ramlibacter sp.]|uniref:M48 family metallopeptidase n=1 Tax=Ramlibacter sp. TaxID=1917967 RepID=UPI002ED1C9C8
MTVGGLAVEVVRKDIKNLHLGVYPPNGRVRIAAPVAMGDESIRLAVVDKLAWIKRQRAAFAQQPRQSTREMVSGESHYFLGRRYRLRLHEEDAPPRVAIRGLRVLDLFVRPGTSTERRLAILEGWYRDQLKEIVPPLMDKWQRALRVRASAWAIKKMKTRWGTCTVEARRVWLNLELAKKPLRSIEYVLVHELAHLRVPSHSEEFTKLLDAHLPDWRERRKELQQSTLGAEEWSW